MAALVNGTPELHEEILAASIELEELRSEPDFVRDNPTDSGAWNSFVSAPIKPQPTLNSGAVALPEPEETSSS